MTDTLITTTDAEGMLQEAIEHAISSERERCLQIAANLERGSMLTATSLRVAMETVIEYGPIEVKIERDGAVMNVGVHQPTKLVRLPAK